MLDQIRSDVSRSVDEISGILDRRGASPSHRTTSLPSDLSDAEIDELAEEDEDELPDLLSHAEIDPRLPIKNTGYRLDLLMQQAGAPLFQRIAIRDLKLKVKGIPRLNYSLVHSGQPLITSLQLNNNSKEVLQNILVKAWVAPDYSEPFQKTIPDILPGKKHVEKSLCLPLIPDLLT